MSTRKPLSKKIRFEVFKRDKFTCQYCGRSAPDVILEVDHIKPVADGGENDLMNLITSCKDCNMGKGARELSDDSIVKKQQAQLRELAEKNEQLEMMLKWRDGIMDIRQKEVESICEVFHRSTGDLSVSDSGKKKIAKWLREFSVLEVMDAMDIALDTYYKGTQNSADYAFNKIPGICNNRKNGQSNHSYWYNYLKKACVQKFGEPPYRSSYLRRLHDICYDFIKDDDDFDNTKSLLYRHRAWSYFINSLEDMFL